MTAPTFQAAAPTFQAISATIASAGGANATYTIPTHQANDIILVVVQNYSNNSAVPLEALTFAQNTAGFTILTHKTEQNNPSQRALFVYWVRATDDATVSPSITCPTNHQVGCVAVLRGCITTGNPWDVTAETDYDTTTTPWIWPTVTTTVADTLIGFFGGSMRDNTGEWMGTLTNTNLASITQQFDDSVTTNAGGGTCIITATSASAQAIGTTSGTPAAGYAGDLITISFIPPVVAGGYNVKPGFFQFF